MANAVKGELGFTANGRELTLCFDIQALCLIEDANDDQLALVVLQQMLRRPTIKRVRQVLWAGLQLHHPEKREGGIDLIAAGELIRAPEVGGVAGLVEKIRAAFEAGYPLPEAAEGAADPPQAPPTRAAAGTGDASGASG